MYHQVGQEQLAVLTISQLQELINSTVNSAISAALKTYTANNSTASTKETKFYTRKQVKEMLHTTYPTLDKYSRPGGILKKEFFGRRVLYRENELNLALPKLRMLIDTNRGKKSAA